MVSFTFCITNVADSVVCVDFCNHTRYCFCSPAGVFVALKHTVTWSHFYSFSKLDVLCYRNLTLIHLEYISTV